MDKKDQYKLALKQCRKTFPALKWRFDFDLKYDNLIGLAKVNHGKQCVLEIEIELWYADEKYPHGYACARATAFGVECYRSTYRKDQDVEQALTALHSWLFDVFATLAKGFTR